MNDERVNIEHFACGSCGAVFKRAAYYDGVGDDLAKALTKTVNSAMFYVRVAKWALANLGKSYKLIERAFQESALEGLCDNWRFQADVKKRARGEDLPDGVVVNTPPINGDN